MSDTDHWSLDKRIPVALIIAVSLSTITGVGTAAVAHYRIGLLERMMDRQQDTLDRRFAAVDVGRTLADREASARDAAVREALGEMRAATAGLRDAVADLRSNMRAFLLDDDIRPPGARNR